MPFLSFKPNEKDFSASSASASVGMQKSALRRRFKFPAHFSFFSSSFQIQLKFLANETIGKIGAASALGLSVPRWTKKNPNGSKNSSQAMRVGFVFESTDKHDQHATYTLHIHRNYWEKKNRTTLSTQYLLAYTFFFYFSSNSIFFSTIILRTRRHFTKQGKLTTYSDF
jgi:hypothetical protein